MNSDVNRAAASLNERTRVRIAIYLASHARKMPLLTALRERGREAGMNGAEMNANEQGTSHDAMATACLRFVKSVVDHPADPALHALQDMYAVGYTLPDILEVMALVAGHDLVEPRNRMD